MFAEPKTRAGVRATPVPAEVTDMLAAHLAEFPAGDHGLIFTTDAGRVVIRPVWSKAYRAACEAAGLDRVRFRSHDLRHVAASSLIASGLSVAAVQAVPGQLTPSETLDVYTHFWPTDEERTARRSGGRRLAEGSSLTRCGVGVGLACDSAAKRPESPGHSTRRRIVSFQRLYGG